MTVKYSPSRAIDDAVADAMAADIIPILDSLPANRLASSLYAGVREHNRPESFTVPVS